MVATLFSAEPICLYPGMGYADAARAVISTNFGREKIFRIPEMWNFCCEDPMHEFSSKDSSTRVRKSSPPA